MSLDVGVDLGAIFGPVQNVHLPMSKFANASEGMLSRYQKP